LETIKGSGYREKKEGTQTERRKVEGEVADVKVSDRRREREIWNRRR